jgi:hypothetical protein
MNLIWQLIDQQFKSLIYKKMSSSSRYASCFVSQFVTLQSMLTWDVKEHLCRQPLSTSANCKPVTCRSAVHLQINGGHFLDLPPLSIVPSGYVAIGLQSGLLRRELNFKLGDYQYGRQETKSQSSSSWPRANEGSVYDPSLTIDKLCGISTTISAVLLERGFIASRTSWADGRFHHSTSNNPPMRKSKYAYSLLSTLSLGICGLRLVWP